MPARAERQHRHLPAFILLTLAHQPMHGGAIHTVLSRQISGFTTDSGAIYRALQNLERDGEIEARWDTTQIGPARKVYQITASGWDKLGVWEEDIQHRLLLLKKFISTYKRLVAARK